jgi:hypothetical protein
MKRIVEKLAYGEMVRYISNCDTCPNFTKNENKVGMCRKFSDPNLIPIITNTFINLHSELVHIIPTWCGLEEYSYNRTNYESNNISNTYNTNRYLPNAYSSNNYYKPKDIKCSYCNEDDDSVERKKNHGLCSKCLEQSKTDATILNKAKLANFKLKRINRVKKSSYSYQFDDDYYDARYY